MTLSAYLAPRNFPHIFPSGYLGWRWCLRGGGQYPRDKGRRKEAGDKQTKSVWGDLWGEVDPRSFCQRTLLSKMRNPIKFEY